MNANTKSESKPSWFSDLSKYAHSHSGKAWWQMLNTIIPYLALWAISIYLMKNHYSYWVVLPITIAAGALLVRIFIFFHDCCHGSFYKNNRLNRLMGYLTGVLAFTPYDEWRRLHNIHHATSGDLERRGTGDIWTMTVEEYLRAGKATRFAYRLFRNPIVLFGLGPFYLFLYSNRLSHPNSKKAEKRSVWITNFIILTQFVGLSFWLGLKTYLLIQLPVLFTAGSIGIWLFYVQHQYEDAYWAGKDDWSLINSALQGSSFYKLPKLLQWLTGNIGFHHIHHLRPKIPNYNLQSCNNNVAALSMVPTLTLLGSLRSMRLHLWDDRKQKLVGFSNLKHR